MTEYSIDALVPWVDGNDPVLAAKRAQYLTPEASGRDDIAGPTRFSNVGEIRYCVASILRFAPWIRRIFIITDGQDPALAEFMEAHFPGRSGRVCIVDHSTIFKGYEKALPVFNSRAIESLMWNIPGLSEHFIYFNDDFMLTASIQPEDFFRPGGQIVCYGSWFPAAAARAMRALKNLGRPVKSMGFKDMMLNAYDCWGAGGGRFVRLSHAPRALLKSWYEQWAKERPDMLQINLKGRFREPFHFQAQEPFYLDMASKGRLVLLPDEDYCMYFKRHGGSGYTERKLESFSSSGKPFVCFNSLDRCSAEEQKQVLNWLERRIFI